MTRLIHLLPVLGCVAAILLSLAGIAAYIGWIPATNGVSGIPPTSGVSGSTTSSRLVQAPATPLCGRCGLVEAVREIGKARGVSSRAVAGATLAQHLGGHGSVTNVLGLLVVALTGRPADQGIGPVTVHEVTVRFEDGSTRALTEVNAPARKPGDLVKVVSGRIYSLPEPTLQAVARAIP